MPSEFIQRQKDDFFRDITSFGSLWFYLILMLVLLMLRNYVLLEKLAIGFILIYAAVITIRSFYFKNRPQKYKYGNFLERIDASSFPSLHAARTIFLASLFIEYFKNKLISILLIILALIVLYSRTYLKKHDWKDVIAGAFFGALVYFVIRTLF